MASIQRREGKERTTWRVKFATASKPQNYLHFASEARAIEFAERCDAVGPELALQWLHERAFISDEPTFAEYASLWLKRREALREATDDTYRKRLNNQCVPLNSTPIDRINREQLKDWVTWMHTERGYSTATMQGAQKLVSSILKAAMDEGRITRNPARGLRVPRLLQGKRVPHVITRSDLEILCSAVSRDTDKALLIVLWCTGMRIGEATALQYKHVRFAADGTGWFELQQSWSGTRKPELVPGKNTSSLRKVFFPAEVAELLKSLGQDHTRDDWVFPAPQGGSMRYHDFRNNVFRHAAAVLAGDSLDPDGPSKPKSKVRYLKDGAGPRVVPHDFRRSFITWSARAGVPITTTAQQVGHSSIDMTANIYTQVQAEDQRGGIQQLNDFLGASPEPRAAIEAKSGESLEDWLRKNHPDVYAEWRMAA